MAKSLPDYLDWLDERGVRWPRPPEIRPVAAKPSVAPIPGLKGVLWNVYGALLRISDGELLHRVDDEFRMQIALEKTVDEFKMWHSMTRKPGAPWKYVDSQYREFLDEARLQAAVPKGETPEIDSAAIWRRFVDRLMQKDFKWDRANLGDMDELCEKIAFFFHASLQGVEAMPGALEALQAVRAANAVQGILADGQCFTLAHLLRHLSDPTKLASPASLFDYETLVFSFQEGIRKPSPGLFRQSVSRIEARGLDPEQVLYVSSVLRGDLDVAKSCGFKTALLAADTLGFKATAADLKTPECRPDRLLTSLNQIGGILTH